MTLGIASVQKGVNILAIVFRIHIVQLVKLCKIVQKLFQTFKELTFFMLYNKICAREN